MMVSFLLGKQNFSFIIEGRTGEKQWGCPLSAGGWTVFLIRKGASRGGRLTILGNICQKFKECDNIYLRQLAWLSLTSCKRR